MSGTETDPIKPRRIRLVLHGKAASRPPVREAVNAIRAEGHIVEVRVTWEAGDTGRIAQEAAEDGVDTVVAGGGDGSITEVVTGLFQSGLSLEERPTLGILPLGTANDFARSCGISLDPLSALRLVAEGESPTVDIGRLGDRYWVNVATGGFGPKITTETSEPLKKMLGGAAYFVTGLTQFHHLTPDEATFRGPDFEWSGAFPILAIGNGRQAGGGNVLCPEALIDDGCLDVRILPRTLPEERGEVIHDLLSEGDAALERRVVQARVPWIEIEAAQPIQINLDGEPVVQERFRFEVVPQSLRVHLPKDTPLLS